MANADVELHNKFLHEYTFVMLKKKLDPDARKELIKGATGKKHIEKVDILIEILKEEEVNAEEVTNECKAFGDLLSQNISLQKARTKDQTRKSSAAKL